MTNKFKQLVNTAVGTALAAAALTGGAWAASTGNNSRNQDLEGKVRHELLMLPYYNIFDDLSFRVDGSRITLTGEVNRPVLRSDAENVVKRIAGVSGVDNQIEVLPLSPFDDRIRLSVARSIYGYTALNRYALGARPSIHIIVRNGNVTLEGVVANEFDRNIAFMRANGVGGAFSVTNNLRISNL